MEGRPASAASAAASSCLWSLALDIHCSLNLRMIQQARTIHAIYTSRRAGGDWWTGTVLSAQGGGFTRTRPASAYIVVWPYTTIVCARALACALQIYLRSESMQSTTTRRRSYYCCLLASLATSLQQWQHHSNSNTHPRSRAQCDGGAARQQQHPRVASAPPAL
mgnify:CR=1 FL=1